MTQKHTEEKDEIVKEEKQEEVTQEKTLVSEEVIAVDWQAKAEEYLTDLKRVQADFENYKKRQIESQKDLRGILIEKLVLDIVPVLDNFRSATQHVPPEQRSSPWVVGIQYIEKQLETVLIDNGMQTIEVKEGDEFDPSIHEAVDAENQESGIENHEGKQKITRVIQKGYKFGERVIRPAKVIVK